MTYVLANAPGQDLNCWSLVSEATTLPTEPQPLPKTMPCFFKYFYLKTLQSVFFYLSFLFYFISFFLLSFAQGFGVCKLRSQHCCCCCLQCTAGKAFPRLCLSFFLSFFLSLYLHSVSKLIKNLLLFIYLPLSHSVRFFFTHSVTWLVEFLPFCLNQQSLGQFFECLFSTWLDIKPTMAIFMLLLCMLSLLQIAQMLKK